ncbi:hypothetical protein H4684_001325 [Desulfomicrobium macestii]|uniref:Uncharacterized protein n=2 Tax=Desulfomicrobium TaxID=898 RepID=A0A8G2C521_DESNO|nr:MULTISPECIES: hypothetical protein [Desulfomicrobium]MBE1424691.1 hypothetical protein [Desulfomicrobium macestii]SFL95859.1 hypothetical protein SAMN05421830_11038 [Desulfomicrobium norvegicum]
MQDKDGIFYYPYPENKRIRMFVREQDGNIEFRLSNVDHPEIWERHGWLDLDIIRRGAKMFEERGSKADPTKIYDVETARYLLKEARKK